MPLRIAMNAEPSTESLSRPSVEAWTFTSEELAQAAAGLRMLNPSLDLSNTCNLNCSYCFVEDLASTAKRRRPGELSLLESLAVIDDFAQAGSRTVNLVGAGEPTVDPHFTEVLKRIHSHGMRTMLFTNGVTISRDPNLSRQLLELGVSVCLKMNSRDHRLQDRLVGRLGYSLERDRALDFLLAAGFAATQPSRLALDVLIMQAVLDEVPTLYEWCLEHNVFALFAEYIPTGRTVDGRAPLVISDRVDMQRPTQEARIELARSLANVDARLGLPIPSGACAYFGGALCTQLLGVYVDIQGTVWPCVARSQRRSSGGPLLKEPLGSIRTNGAPASYFWSTHPYMKQLRANYTGGCPYKLPVPSGQSVPLRPRRNLPTEPIAMDPVSVTARTAP